MSGHPPPADPNDEAAIRNTMLHPAFPAAARHIGRQFLALHSDVRIHKAISDEGRYIVSQFIVSLHASHRQGHAEALTRAGLMRRCLGFGIMSHGRIDAILGLLRHSRRLLDGEPGADRRSRALLPAPALESEFRARARFHLEGLAMLRPDRPWLARLRDDPDFFWELEHERGGFIAEQPSLRLRLPALIALAHIEGGYLVMMALLDGLEDPTRPGVVPARQSDLALRLNLPRTQLRRVLQALEEAQLIQRAATRGEIEVCPLATTTMMAWHAIRLLRFDLYSMAAAMALDRRRAGAGVAGKRRLAFG